MSVNESRHKNYQIENEIECLCKSFAQRQDAALYFTRLRVKDGNEFQREFLLLRQRLEIFIFLSSSFVLNNN